MLPHLPRTALALGAAVLLGSASLPASLHAQSRTTSALRGSVLGPDGGPISGAVVQVRHEGTGAERSALTNDRGAFLVLLLQPGGPYTVTVQYLGYAAEGREGLQLQVGEVTALEFVLREEAVEVEGIDVSVDRAEIFNPNQVGPATLLDERVVESTPILSRDIMDLAVLSPLVKRTEGGGFSVAGQNDRYNAILVDGIVSKDAFGLTAGGVPGGQAGAKLIPLDAVAQYEVLVAPFDVRLSGFTGGVMNAVTRSGTNDWRVRAGAVHRAEALMGDLSLPTGPVDASGVDRSLVALSVGGPLKRDEAHFFLSAEVEERHQPPTGYNLFRDDPNLVRISPEMVQTFQETWASEYGLDPGRADVYPLGRSLANVFARFDLNLSGGSRLTARNVFARAESDEAPNRTGFGPYELSSNAVSRSSTSNITSLQLFSDFGNWGANELDLNVQRVTDHSDPAATWPQVEVELISGVGELNYRRAVRAGGDFFAQQSDLEQTTVRLTNSLSVTRGDNLLTFGVTGAYYDIGHTFLPGARGEYYFADFDDISSPLRAPDRYQRTVLTEGNEPGVDVNVLEWGAFVQHQIGKGGSEQGLTMRFGLRIDVPWVLSSPPENVDFLDYFGYHTSRVPSGNVMVSPRWGFNWQGGGERTTQVRGGAGVFSGQLPYVWLANAFHNDGLRQVTLLCQGRYYLEPQPPRPAPVFDPGTDPASCYDGRPFIESRNVVTFAEDFLYPQDLKFSIVVDQELTDGISGSLGVLFNKALNQVGLRELNAESGGSPGGNQAFGGPGRRYYDRIGGGIDKALLVTNEGEDWGASVTAELRGSLTDRVRFQLGYALARSWDRTSLVYTDMISNFGLNPVEGDIQKPRLTTSDFDRPHKFVASVFGAPFPWSPRTEVSLLYTGQSGLPFSYVYRWDVNGDGYPGSGPSFDRYNDLLYAPEEVNEYPMTIATQVLMEAALEDDECLRRNRGRVVPRNDCRAPWEHRLDLRLAHSLDIGGATVRLEGDLINVLNLLSSDLGKVESIQPVVPLLDALDGNAGRTAQWGGAVLPRRDEGGRLRPTTPWNVVSPDSQWQLQFGARVTLGEGR
ncbi:MAG: carboxypeptidase regulatory-like domain-containing protein [Gemmatimonadota bacterium]